MRFALLVALAACGAPRPVADPDAVTGEAPLFDGHVDVAIHYAKAGWALDAYDLASSPHGQTSLDRMRAGGAGGGLLTCSSVTEPGAGPHWPSLAECLAFAPRLIAAYPDRAVLATTARGVREANAAGRIAFVLAIEGGDQLDGDLANIRKLAAAGVRSVGIVYDHHNDLGDGAQAFVQAPVPPPFGGLSPLGVQAVTALQRAGIVVDVAHAAETTALAAARIARAPLLVSHTGARALVETPRNVSDDVIRAVAKTDGAVLITFVPYLISPDHATWWIDGERTYERLTRQHPGDAAAVERGMATWDAGHPMPKVTIAQVADHIDHVARVAGKRHVGLGSDFDGMGPHHIPDLSDHRGLPRLWAELAARGWTRQELRGLLRENVLRVLEAAEQVAAGPA